LAKKNLKGREKKTLSKKLIPYVSFGRVFKTAYGRLKNGWKPTLPPHSSFVK
jgi:hypothetical protein